MSDDHPKFDMNEADSPRQFMALTTSHLGWYRTISCLVCFVIVTAIFVGVSALCGASRQELAGIVLLFSFVLLISLLGSPERAHFLVPSNRARPLLTVTGKFVEFDIPQLFLAQINSKNTISAMFGFKQRPLQSPFVTIVTACRWEISPDKRKVFVTTRIPVWGPFKIRMRTEWDVPELAMDRWDEFVSKVNQAEQT